MYLDESWFVLWPQPAPGWAGRRRPPLVPKAKSWPRGERPPSTCLYATMDVLERTVTGAWHTTWNQDETWADLQTLIRDYAATGTRYLVVLWDNAPWHVARRLHERLAEHNRQAKGTGGLRVLLFQLPTRAPWLMPLEPVFGQTKRAVGSRQRETLIDLETAVDHRLEQRNRRGLTRRQHRHRLTSLVRP